MVDNPRIKKLADLLNTEFPPESDEVPYRRGYRDGFIHAIIYLQDRPLGISNEQLMDILYSHWEGPLAAWQRRAAADEFEPPPQAKILGDVYRRQFSAAQRREIIDAAAFTCFYCGREEYSYTVGPGGKPWHVDHRVPLARGGTNEQDNLVLACERCNLRKHTS